MLLNQTFRTSSNMKLEVLVFRFPGLFPVCCYFLRRQAMYIYRNSEARSCNHCRNGSAKSSTYPECVFDALGIRVL